MHRLLTLASLGLTLIAPAAAQGVLGNDGIYVLAEKAPEPVGGIGALYQHLTYPDSALAAGAEGTVVVTFIVNPDGALRDVAVQRTPHPALGAAALRAMNAVTYAPGLVGGAPVPTRVSLPIRFVLPAPNAAVPEAAPEATAEAVALNTPARPLEGWESLLRKIDWPEEAAQSGVEGVFLIEIDVDERGSVTDAVIAEAKVERDEGRTEAIARPRRDPARHLRNVDRRPTVSSVQTLMERAILRVVASARFVPEVRDGEVVASRVLWPIEFYLHR